MWAWFTNSEAPWLLGALVTSFLGAYTARWSETRKMRGADEREWRREIKAICEDIDPALRPFSQTMVLTNAAEQHAWVAQMEANLKTLSAAKSKLEIVAGPALRESIRLIVKEASNRCAEVKLVGAVIPKPSPLADDQLDNIRRFGTLHIAVPRASDAETFPCQPLSHAARYEWEQLVSDFRSEVRFALKVDRPQRFTRRQPRFTKRSSRD